MVELESELQRAEDQLREADQKLAAVVERYRGEHAAHEEASRTAQQLMVQMEKSGAYSTTTAPYHSLNHRAFIHTHDCQ